MRDSGWLADAAAVQTDVKFHQSPLKVHLHEKSVISMSTFDINIAVSVKETFSVT